MEFVYACCFHPFIRHFNYLTPVINRQSITSFLIAPQIVNRWAPMVDLAISKTPALSTPGARRSQRQKTRSFPAGIRRVQVIHVSRHPLRPTLPQRSRSALGHRPPSRGQHRGTGGEHEIHSLVLKQVPLQAGFPSLQLGRLLSLRPPARDVMLPGLAISGQRRSHVFTYSHPYFIQTNHPARSAKVVRFLPSV